MLEGNLQTAICCSISDGADRVDWSNLSSSSWEKLVDIADSQRVAPLLLWSFNNSNQTTRNLVPETIHKRLLLLYIDTTRRNLHLFRELEQFSGLLNQQSIKTVVLKGAALANSVYEDNGLRPMADIDLLIPREKLSTAVELANSIGFYDPYPEAGPGLKGILSHHVYLRKEEPSPVQMELHHTLVGGDAFRYNVLMDWFFTQVEPFSLLNLEKDKKYSNVFKLTPTAQILFSAAHITLQHGLTASPLIWFYDLDRICRVDSDRINWDVLLEKAGEFHWDSSLSIALHQTREKFNTPIPEETLRQLYPENAHRYSSLIDLKAKPSRTRMQAEWKKIISLNWVGRLRLLTALIFPSPAYMRYRYKFDESWKLPFFYFYRWGFIFLDGLRTTTHILIKK